MRVLIDISAHDLRLPRPGPGPYRVTHSFRRLTTGLLELCQLRGIYCRREALDEGIPLVEELIELRVVLDDPIATASRLREMLLCVGKDVHVDMPVAEDMRDLAEGPAAVESIHKRKLSVGGDAPRRLNLLLFEELMKLFQCPSVISFFLLR